MGTITSPTAPLISAALAYARRGWPVLALRPHTKLPATRHGLHDATTDPDVIRRWWTRWPDANVGLATGAAFDVLDLDQPDAARTLEHTAGARLPVGPTVVTGHGRHHYFAPTGAGNRAAMVDGVDWRGHGGYVVAPPSLHPSGHRYLWVRTRGPRLPLPDVPPWLHRLVTPPPPQPSCVPSPISATSSGRYGAKALNSETARVAAAPQGCRNHTLVRAAFRMGQLVAAGLLDTDHAICELRRAAVGAGLSPREANATITSGLHGGLTHPRPQH